LAARFALQGHVLDALAVAGHSRMRVVAVLLAVERRGVTRHRVERLPGRRNISPLLRTHRRAHRLCVDGGAAQHSGYHDPAHGAACGYSTFHVSPCDSCGIGPGEDSFTRRLISSPCLLPPVPAAYGRRESDTSNAG